MEKVIENLRKENEQLKAMLKESEQALKNCALHSVSERFLLVQWMDGQPKIDGALYFDTQDECIEYYRSLSVFEEFNITHTICRISNAH